ncbi:MAG: UvrD-helicase domain-containing protein [Prolixibacteraceae bacterium]
MSQLTIYKASAGSGKTYRLVLEYIKLLIVNPYNYRHILAVTFTNKATTEMKERILRDLHKVATSADGGLLKALLAETGLSVLKIEDHAKLALSNILHDYDRFAVSTIDSFFQRVLRSFARESGLYGTYEIELDQGAVLEEACDRLLLSVDEDEELRKWLITMSEDQLGEGKTWRINDKILELGKELYNESFQPYLINFESIAIERQKLKILKKEITVTQKWFESSLKELSRSALEMISAASLELSDFKGGSRSFVNYFSHWANFRKDKLEPTATLLKAMDVPENWVVKKHPKYDLIIQVVQQGLNEHLKKNVTFIEQNRIKYTTALEIQKYIHALGVLTTLSAKVREIGLERNSLLLSEGNTLLRGIIGTNDAPFIYEKTGSFFNYYMIDEFQDTSVTQWENFKPLVSNSLAENHPNLVVGDVKQSIYRWRNSDWQLLDRRLKNELAQFKVVETPLDANWRSSENIVEFNNQFFLISKTILQESFNAELGELDSPILREYRQTIAKAYSDVVQKPKSGLKDGFVQCEFLSGEDKSDYETKTLDRLIEAVKQVQDKGYRARDIAILVKKNTHGKLVAEALLNEKKKGSPYNFEVISDDTLFIDNSSSVQFVVGLMRHILAPSDQVIKATVVHEYANHLLPHLVAIGRAPMKIAVSGQQTFGFTDTATEAYHFISEEVRADYFPFFDHMEKRAISQQWAHRSLIDLTDELIQRYHLDQLTGEQASLQAFKDVVNDFSKRESGNLHKFMSWWEQFGGSIKLQTAGQRNAIRIMTIHKSKGLEFPVVFLPFCDWMFQPDASKSTILWCSTQSTTYQQFPILPVKFSKNLRKSDFAENYFTEMILSYIDNLNVLYVAQTRAVKGLYIFTNDVDKEPVQTSGQLFNAVFRKIGGKGLPIQQTDNIYATGVLPMNETSSEELRNDVNLSAKVKQQKNMKDTLRLKRNYLDFLDENQSERSIQINQGKLFHELLSFLKTREDLSMAIQHLIVSGKIAASESPRFKHDVEVLLDHPKASDWFNASYKVLNEKTIIAPGFALSRPDRIMLRENKIIVVDYKSTDLVRSNHQRQVLSYVESIKEMGYSQVEGYVWYLKSNQILNVYDDY